MRTWCRVQRVLMLTILIASAPLAGTQSATAGAETSAPTPPVLPRFVFATEAGLVVDLADRHADLFAECIARWPEHIDQQAPMGALLPEPVTQHIRGRVTERTGDAYQLLQFGVSTGRGAQLTRFTYHSQGAHAGLDGFMGLLTVPGWTPEVSQERLRPIGLAWRTASPLRFRERDVPPLSAGERAQARKALEAAFPGHDLPDAELRSLGRVLNGELGVVAVLHDRATKDVLLSVTLIGEDGAYVVPIDTRTSSVLCPNRFALYLHEGNPEHCAPVLNGAYFILPDFQNDGNPGLAIVSDTASTLLQFSTGTTSSRAIPGYVLSQVTGFSYGF